MGTAESSMTERYRARTARALEQLRERFGDRLQTGEAVRRQHSHTTTYLPAQLPDGVIRVESREEVQRIVEICAQHRMAVIPFGVGTSLEGHVNAPCGGIVVDMSGMDRILAVHAEDLTCTVEPGVTREQLNQHLRDTGLFFPIDPGANASLGGMAATRAAGTNAVRYGTMRDNVLSLEAVMASGEIIRTGRRARKSAAGYDLTRLIIGSEGTLGIITELTLRLHGIPQAIAGGVCPFLTVEAACRAVTETIQSGIPVARIELLNRMQMQAINAWSKLDYPDSPCLFVEFHGSDNSVREDSAAFGEIATSHGGGPFRWATAEEERQKLWKARHNAFWAALALRPGASALSTDVCVPVSRLAECIAETEADLAGEGMQAPIVGHVGDGNFHVLMLMDPGSPEEVAKVERLVGRMNRRALAMDGTCTGEHGIGQGKRPYMQLEHGEAGLDVMRAIKAALDPLGILNPGKILPQPDAGG